MKRVAVSVAGDEKAGKTSLIEILTLRKPRRTEVEEMRKTGMFFRTEKHETLASLLEYTYFPSNPEYLTGYRRPFSSSDAVIVVIDALVGITPNVARAVKACSDTGAETILMFNKIDLLYPASIAVEAIEKMASKMRYDRKTTKICIGSTKYRLCVFYGTYQELERGKEAVQEKIREMLKVIHVSQEHPLELKKYIWDNKYIGIVDKEKEQYRANREEETASDILVHTFKCFSLHTIVTDAVEIGAGQMERKKGCNIASAEGVVEKNQIVFVDIAGASEQELEQIKAKLSSYPTLLGHLENGVFAVSAPGLFVLDSFVFEIKEILKGSVRMSQPRYYLVRAPKRSSLTIDVGSADVHMTVEPNVEIQKMEERGRMGGAKGCGKGYLEVPIDVGKNCVLKIPENMMNKDVRCTNRCLESIWREETQARILDAAEPPGSREERPGELPKKHGSERANLEDILKSSIEAINKDLEALPIAHTAIYVDNIEEKDKIGEVSTESAISRDEGSSSCGCKVLAKKAEVQIRRCKWYRVVKQISVYLVLQMTHKRVSLDISASLPFRISRSAGGRSILKKICKECGGKLKSFTKQHRTICLSRASLPASEYSRFLALLHSAFPQVRSTITKVHYIPERANTFE